MMAPCSTTDTPLAVSTSQVPLIALGSTLFVGGVTGVSLQAIISSGRMTVIARVESLEARIVLIQLSLWDCRAEVIQTYGRPGVSGLTHRGESAWVKTL